ncbi:MAG: flagellar type III secretion system pore protein FliP [Christensenellales bacterium]
MHAVKRGAWFKKAKKIALLITILLLAVLLAGCSAWPVEAGEEAESDGGLLSGLFGTRSESINILLLLTVLTLLPSILIMLTGFTRIIIVLSLLRNALGTQQMPPNQVLIGLALFLTFFVMSPVVDQINVNAYQPYVEGRIDEEEAMDLAMQPVREFMFRQTYKSDLNFFVSAAATADGEPIEVETHDDIPNRVLIPAFITSEIKHGFLSGFLIYIPFIVIDMIVASTLMAMGMMMLPPVMISLPFKILLFVVVDGWTLTVQSLITGFV